ncbi:OLC1v1027330C1 [Oldenlandia corymbosa var. corymbosa]|uniref:OLC1v1027330C1 n=1 Tax=Oldenlandia corymbosa var. corymbosa TaxID=529605 RepID=A0AAV1CB28_OLDCO|nr:OLC1v1027330C1 [Oldenlandia corymbosa var. corymbosa]
MELEKKSSSSAASVYAKRFMSMLRSMTKAKSILTAIKCKSEAVKARLLVFSLLRNVKKPSPLVALTHKIQSSFLPKSSSPVIGGDDLQCCSQCCCSQPDQEAQDQQALVVYNYGDDYLLQEGNDDADEAKDELEQLVLQQAGDPDASVIDLVRNSKENFSLEDDIDHVADLFIMKIHKRMRLQKLESFKRYQEMLQRSAA